MTCCDVSNCNLLQHCITSLSSANSSANENQDDNTVEVEFESATNENLHLIVKYLNSWRARKCACVIRRSAHHSLVEVLFMLTTKSLVEELEKLCAIFHSLDDQDASTKEESTHETDGPEKGAEKPNKLPSRPSTPLVSEELEDLLLAVEVIFSSEFPLSNQYFNKPNILCRVLKNLILKQRFMTSVTEFLKSASPNLLPLNFVHSVVKLICSVLRCVSQETVKNSDEIRLVNMTQRCQLRSALVHYMKQLNEDDLRNPKARQSVEFCWDRIQEMSLDTIDTDCLDLALKYIKSSTLTMRLSGLAFVNQQVTICERKQQQQSRGSSGTSHSSHQQSLAASKSTFKRWLRSQHMVSILFGPNTHVELVRQCHLILQFMAGGQLLTELDVDVLWTAVNDKYKSREVISAVEGILHYLNEHLLERFKGHLQELPIGNHTDQTFSLSCQITKVSWRRQLMTLNIAHQFGSILASEKRKRKHRTVAGKGSSLRTSSQSSASAVNVIDKNAAESYQDDSVSPNQTSDSLALNDESQYPPNATVAMMGGSPVLVSSKKDSGVPKESPAGTRSGLNPPGEWTDSNGSPVTDQSPSQYSSKFSKISKNDAPKQPSTFGGSKRRKLDRKGVKAIKNVVPPPPPPPLRLNQTNNSANMNTSPDESSPEGNRFNAGFSKVQSKQQNLLDLEKAVVDADLQELNDDQENVLQAMNELFRGIQDSKTGFDVNSELNVDIGTGDDLRQSVDSNMEPVSDNADVESHPGSATGRRNSEPDELPEVAIDGSPQDHIEEEESDEDDDEVEELDDGDEEAASAFYCNQMFIRELLQQEGIMKPLGMRPSSSKVDSAKPLTVDTSSVHVPSETCSNMASAGISASIQMSNQDASQVSTNAVGNQLEEEQSYDFDVISDQDESNSTDSTVSSSSSTPSFSSSSFFVKPGNSLIWDLLTSNRLSELAPEQQECVKQNLFDLIVVFLKYPEVLKEMVRSLLNAIHSNCSTFICVKMLQALFSNVVSLSSYAIQTHSMLDVLVSTILNLVQAESQSSADDRLESDSDLKDPENLHESMMALSQAELGEFLHLFDAIFHKTNHCVCYTFSDEHVISLWTVLSNNPNYKDFFLNWLCGICQTDEIHIMTEQQWLMIYCKLVMTDSQYSKLQLDVFSTQNGSVANPASHSDVLEVCTSSVLQNTCPVLTDLAEIHLLAVLFCKAVKGVFFSEQQSTPSGNSHVSSVEVEETLNSTEPAIDPEARSAVLSEIRSDLISAGLAQFWEVLLTSKDSDMQKMARDVLNGYYLHLPQLGKEREFVSTTVDRVSKFLESDEAQCLANLKELQSIVCLLLHHIQQSYKKYAFHIRYSALKLGVAPIHSHSKTWMPRKGSHQLKLFLSNRSGGVNQPKVITMQSCDFLGELRAEVSYHQTEMLRNGGETAEEKRELDSYRLKYYRMLTNGVELKLEHDDRTLSDLCIRDESQIAAVLTCLPCDDSVENSPARFQLGDVFLKFPGCLYLEPPLENYPQTILLQEVHFNRLFELLRRLSNLKNNATKSQIFNIDDIIRLVWDLIMLLPTYPAIQQQFAILSTERGEPKSSEDQGPSQPSPMDSSIDWTAILDVDNVFKLLYSLQMLEHLAINCHSKSSQVAGDAALTPRGFGGHGSNLLTPTLPNFDSAMGSGDFLEVQQQGSMSGLSKNKVQSDWCQKFVEYGGLRFLINVFESKILLQDYSDSKSKESVNVQWSEWKQECLASILRLFNIFSIHPYTSGGLILRTPNAFGAESLGVGPQSEMFIATQSGDPDSSSRLSFVSMLDKTLFLDSLFVLMNSASRTQTDAVSRRTLSLKSNLVCQCFRILNLNACHDASICESLMNHRLFSSLIYQLVVNFATKNISKTSATGITKLAQRSFAFCKKTIQQLIDFLAEVRSISESTFEDHNNRDSRDSSVIADPSSGQEYFALFENLMRIYLEKEEERANDEEFVSYLVSSITSALSEFLENSFWSEEHGDCSSLRGLLTIMCSICRLKPPFITSEQGLELIKTLIRCLFIIEPETKTPKFVNPDSRKAAFDLIVQLASGSVKNYEYIYEVLMQQNSKESHAPYPWSYWPLDERRSDAGFVGLINLGATCYMATALQHLFMIHEARSAILSANQNEMSTASADIGSIVASNSNTVASSAMERKHGKILQELQKMFAYLQLSDRKAYNPRSFCRSYVMDNEPLNTCDQKDMTEFFNDLISKLEDMTPELRDLVHNLFRGEITNSVVSLDCSHVSKTVEQFYTVRCQVADLRDLYESLDEFCQIDMLEGDNMYTCSSCQTKVRAEKRASFKKLPRILVINTMRYKFNMESMAREKVNTHFLFPNHINMGKYTETFLVGDSRGTGSSNSNPGIDSSQQEEMNYELIGVTVHTGAAESGHYYCFVRDRTFPQSDVWFLFNDSEVKPFNPDNIPQECFGGQMVSKTFNQLTEKFVDYAFEKSHSAYMLFYERSVDLMRNEDKASLIQSNLNPAETFCAAINTDNLQLRHDRTLFDKNYFEFLYKFNDVVAKTMPKPGDPNSAAQFDFQRAKLSTTFVLETLVHSRESPSINFWLDFVTSLYSECVEVCKWLVKHLSHNDWWLNQVLIRCPSAHIRGLFQKLIFLAITTICNKVSEEDWQMYCKSDLRAFLKTFISFTNSSLLKRRHLRHFFEYCSLLMDVAKMGKREALLIISVGAIGHMVKFFLDVKLQKNQPIVSVGPQLNTTNTTNTSDEEDAENAASENDIIASTAVEFDALNELLSFTADGKKKSAVFHNIVELLELLLDRACSAGSSSSGSSASVNRDFQDLARCLNESDLGALTSNSYEFLKILIEEEINLDSVSSILQMLIRMNKSFENFIPVRFCELILSSGSPDIVKPYFRILAKLEAQLQTVSVTQHIIKYIPKLLQWCPRATLGLLKDCVRSPYVVTWALQNLELWVKQFLIAENTYRVRFEAAEIVLMLIPDNLQMYNYWKNYVDKFTMPENKSFDHDEKAVAVLHKILRHLLNMLEEFATLSMGTYRFQYYFTVLTALSVSNVEKRMFTPYFPHLWNVFYPHLIHSKVENCVNKQALLFYWHWVCVDCPQNVEIIVSNKVVLKNMFFNYILVNHEERELIAFNKQCLHSFFGLIKICCEHSPQFALVFMQHENFLWALENVFPYFNLYSKASNDLLRIVEILLSYANGDESSTGLSGHSSGGQLSSSERREILAFKRKLIFQFTKCLTKRGLWITVPRIFSVLLQTESDFKYFVTDTPGLRILSEALASSFEASHHVSIFHSSASSNLSNANAAISSRSDMIELLTRTLFNFRNCAIEAPHSSVASTSEGTPSSSRVGGSKPVWKNVGVVCEKLLSLLNPTQDPENRMGAMSCLKEIMLAFPDEASPVLLEALYNGHTSCTRKKCATNVPGAFYPRSSGKPADHHQHTSSASVSSSAAVVPAKPAAVGVLGFTAGTRRFELLMCVHCEHFSSPIGSNDAYDESLRQFFSPYYSNVVQPVLSSAISCATISPKLIELVCILSLDAVKLRLDWFAKMLIEYFKRESFIEALCGSFHFALLFVQILQNHRSALSVSSIFSFCTSFVPKAREFSPSEKAKLLQIVASEFVQSAYHVLLAPPPTLPQSNEATVVREKDYLISEINENLRALQLLLVCSGTESPVDLSSLKNQLQLLQAEADTLKAICVDPLRKTMMSSTSSVATSDLCNLPLKKLKLAQTTPSELTQVDPQDVISVAATDTSDPDTSAASSSNVTTVLVSSLEVSADGGNRELSVSKSAVISLIKHLSSTLMYLRQYEDRCKGQT